MCYPDNQGRCLIASATRPTATTVAATRAPANKTTTASSSSSFLLLLSLLLLSSWLPSVLPASLIEHQRYDGWYNNLAHPDWGSLGTFVSLSASMPASVNQSVSRPGLPPSGCGVCLWKKGGRLPLLPPVSYVCSLPPCSLETLARSLDHLSPLPHALLHPSSSGLSFTPSRLDWR